ncbi:MAG: gamma carbonic anhydrase family protein [Candidatus Methylacidiphilales bacterium]
MAGRIDFGVGVEHRLQHLAKEPDIRRAAFIAPGCTIVGDVVLERDSSVFYGAVLRGDIDVIRIGEGTNIQDGAIVHLGDDAPAIIGDYCTIGHGAIVHGCRIGNETLIGMGAIVLDYAEVGARCVIGANSLVPKGMKIPDGSMVYGSPAKVVRTLSEEDQLGLRTWAEKYIVVAKAHAAKIASRKG